MTLGPSVFFLLNGVPKFFWRPLKNIKLEEIIQSFAPQARKILRCILFPVDFSLKIVDFEHNFSKIFTKSSTFLQNVPTIFVSNLKIFSVYLKFLGIYLKKNTLLSGNNH